MVGERSCSARDVGQLTDGYVLFLCRNRIGKPYAHQTSMCQRRTREEHFWEDNPRTTGWKTINANGWLRASGTCSYFNPHVNVSFYKLLAQATCFIRYYLLDQHAIRKCKRATSEYRPVMLHCRQPLACTSWSANERSTLRNFPGGATGERVGSAPQISVKRRENIVVLSPPLYTSRSPIRALG